ncbi:MAG: sigma-70 family RNA polymerase sigma factor [Casimicrobiaceae bacterium]
MALPFMAIPSFTKRGRFERAVRAYSGDLYAYAYWLCRDRQQARDLVQEACLRAWSGWGGLRDDSAVKAWLFTIVRNEHARSFERKQVAIADDDPDSLAAPADFALESALEVREALGVLPESLREPLLLQVLGGFTCGEIAAMLETTEGAVMTRLTRARQAMRHLIEGSTPDNKERSIS